MNNIKKLREGAGYNMKEAAAMLGIPYTTYVNYEKGYREPNSEMLIKIADLFDTTVDYIIGKATSFVTPAAENIIPMPKMNRIPLIGTIACGTPILAVENIEDEVDIPEDIHADFALRCKGDSVIGADIRDGDIVYIRQQDEVNPGQIAAVLVEEATLKRFYYDEKAGVVTLMSENPAIAPLIYQGETLNHIRVLGLAVGLTRKI